MPHNDPVVQAVAAMAAHAEEFQGGLECVPFAQKDWPETPIGAIPSLHDLEELAHLLSGRQKIISSLQISERRCCNSVSHELRVRQSTIARRRRRRR